MKRLPRSVRVLRALRGDLVLIEIPERFPPAELKSLHDEVRRIAEDSGVRIAVVNHPMKVHVARPGRRP